MMTDEYFKLYCECFPKDGEVASSYMFSHRLDAARRMDVRENGELRSALYLVDKKVYFRGEIITVPHIVALGTFEKYRNKGYAKELLKKTFEVCKESPFITLYPFSHAFYEKFGFATVSYVAPLPDAERTEVKNDGLLLSLYNRLCEGLDFYNVRTEDDFGFYRTLHAIDGESYNLLDGGVKGFASPDEYIPPSIDDCSRPGVMARIINLEKAVKLSKLDLPEPLSVVDGYIGENNVSFAASNGEIRLCSEGKETDIRELCASCFGKGAAKSPPIRGFLADKY